MSDRPLRVGSATVAVAGVVLAGYLTWGHYRDGSVACPVGGGCETVQESAYAELLGVPVALLGLVAYLVLAVVIAWDAPVARVAAAAIALTGMVFSGYLLVVQLFVLDATCVWCLVNDIAIAPTLAVATALRLRV